MSSKTQVLVVDDEAAILRFLKPALEANNYEMTSAGTVAEATKRIAAESVRWKKIIQEKGITGGE